MPTEAQVKTEITNFLAIPEALRKFLYVNATNYLALESALTSALFTDYGDAVTTSLYALRGRLNGALTDGGAVVAAFMIDMGKALNLSATELFALLEELRVYYSENSRKVSSRRWSRGTPSAAGGNTGSGTINRLTKDEYGFDIETGFAEAIEAEVTLDVGEGSLKHEEVLTFKGSSPDRDAIKITGTGISPTKPTCISARESMDVVANCSFDVYQGASAAAPDSITNWTPGSDIANFGIDTTKYYRDYEGATAPSSLKILDDDELTQAFTVRRHKFTASVPYYMQVAVNRDSSGFDGNFTFEAGNSSVVVAGGSLAANSWEIVRVALGTGNWYKNFNETAAAFKVKVDSRSTGHILVDDLLVAPFRKVKGTWYAPVGGATKFLYRDSFTWTDSEGSGGVVTGIINWFLNFFFGVYLPASQNTTLITWPDPA